MVTRFLERQLDVNIFTLAAIGKGYGYRLGTLVISLYLKKSFRNYDKMMLVIQSGKNELFICDRFEYYNNIVILYASSFQSIGQCRRLREQENEKKMKTSFEFQIIIVRYTSRVYTEHKLDTH